MAWHGVLLLLLFGWGGIGMDWDGTGRDGACMHGFWAGKKDKALLWAGGGVLVSDD